MAASNQVPVSMLVTVLLALAPSSSIIMSSCADAFVSPTPTSSSYSHSAVASSSHTSLFMMAEAATPNKKEGQQKKRRFLQHVHPAVVSPQSSPLPSPASDKQQQSKGAATSKFDNRTLNNNKNITNNATKRSKTNERRASGDNINNSKRIGPPLQTNKSIEDLEAILEKRWGTASPQTRISPGGEADFVFSFGSDDDVYDDDKGKNKSTTLKGAAVFRSKWVVDPWAEEEGIYDDSVIRNDDNSNKRNSNEMDYNEESDKSSKKTRYNRQEAMLYRVRANQDRLQNKRGGDGNKTFNVPVDISRDYYDEDDEGYESRQRSRSSESLVAPQPAGGDGSMSSSSSSILSGGMFSGRSSTNDKRPRRKIEDTNDGEEIDEKKKVKKKQEKLKEPQSKPVLDEDGNEMFLTLEQADKIVQKILSSSSSSKDGGDDDADSDDYPDNGFAQWEDIGITDSTLLSNLQSSTMSCLSPLPVQEKACPPILVGNDVLVSTHTGSGKTLAFLAPIAQSLLMDTNNIKGTSTTFPKAIIVAPGRELASQIVSVGQTLFAGTDLTISLAIGGTPFSRNVESLRKRKPDIVVGTPGRIAELIIGRPGEKGGKMKIAGVQTIVLDEFDALLQYDVHKEPTVAIMEAMDRQHGESLQRVLCSATATDMMGVEQEGKITVEAYLRPGYAHASVDESDVLVTAGVTSKEKGKTKTSPRVSRTTIHGALHVPHRRYALDAVRKVLNTDPFPQQALIFVDSPRRVDIVIEKLAEFDIVAAPLHGGASSGKGDRAEVNKALREGYVGCVVCTEIAARGIDAPYLTHVINLDLPTDASHYAHRAGRCGRGGRPGVSVSITCDEREKNVPRRLAEELGITMYNVEARKGKLRIIER